MTSARMAALGSILFMFYGCGGSQPERRERRTDAHEDFSVPSFLLDYAQASTRLFAKADPSRIDEIRDSLRQLGGKKRRAAYRDLAASYLLSAEGREDSKDAKRDWRNAKRAASKALSGAREDVSRSEALFVHLWVAWRGRDKDAMRRATEFTSDHRSAGELYNMAWVIRGEIDLGAKRYARARKNYGFLFGQLDHPLYGLALLRTADAYEAEENIKEADAALDEVLLLACNANPSPATLQISRVAAGQLEIPVREDASGTMRPVTCKEIKSEPNRDKPWLNK